MWKRNGLDIGNDEIYTTALLQIYFFNPIMNHNRVDYLKEYS